MENQTTDNLYSFSIETISFGISGQYQEQCYRLSNNTILLSSERDAHGNYYGGAGVNGLFLRTGATYRPVYNQQNQLLAFEKIN